MVRNDNATKERTQTMSKIAIFKNRYQANKEAKKLVGWDWKIISYGDGYAIRCNGYRFLKTDGFIG